MIIKSSSSFVLSITLLLALGNAYGMNNKQFGPNDPNWPGPQIWACGLSIALYNAINENNVAQVKQLVKEQGYPKVLMWIEPHFVKCTVLSYACLSNCDSKIVKIFLKAGADPAQKDSDDTTPLYWAKHHNNHKIIELLENHSQQP